MIEIRNLYKSFGPKEVFTGLDLDVEPGQTHVVVGRSGEGKSVLLKHICGLMCQDSGTVSVKGMELWKDKRAMAYVRNRVSMVFQMAALFDSLTVYENVAFYHLENGGKTRGEMDRIVAELLELVDLPSTEQLYPGELSGGMRKRVGLARALASDPEIILYDEPTTGLDPVTSEVINGLMLRAQERQKMTSMVITHDMRSAYTVGDRISMLYEGKIIFSGSPEVVRETENPIVRQFVDGMAKGPITQNEDEEVKTRCSMVIDRSKLHLD